MARNACSRTRFLYAESSYPRDEPLSAAAQGQSGRIGGHGGRKRSTKQSVPTNRSCCRSAMPPATGATSWRTRASRTTPPRRDERAVRQHQSRPRGTAGHRSDLHGGAASSRRAWRLAADDVSHARRRADLGRHLFSQNLALRQAGLRRRAARDRAAVSRRAAKDRAQPRRADGAARRCGAAGRRRHDRRS